MEIRLPENFNAEIELPSSKSIHNRVLILNALFDLGMEITHPSDSGDTRLLQTLLNSPDRELYCENAGTVIRFLTAYFAAKGGEVTLAGSPRMERRPIAPLVQTLQKMGASIDYLKEPGFPPLRINKSRLKAGKVEMQGDISSQFISAILMIAPNLEEGLTIELVGKIASEPYLRMTLALMKQLGFRCDISGKKVDIKPGSGGGLRELAIEPDWSAVAFWVEILALSKNGKLLIRRLKKESVQGDSILGIWSERLGVRMTEKPEGMILEKIPMSHIGSFDWDLGDYPDLAPALVVLLSALKQKAVFKGLGTLKLKESDRTQALQNELKKCGVQFNPKGEDWHLDADAFALNPGTLFENYGDHRMAMALAPLGIIAPVFIDNPEVVEKSYPEFWKDLKELERKP